MSEQDKLALKYPLEDVSVSTALALARATISSIPVFGGPVNELIGAAVGATLNDRREQWELELASVVDRLVEEDVSVEEVLSDKRFGPAVIKATQIAYRAERKEKMEYLRNALLNVVSVDAPNEDYQQIFFNTIDSFTVTHIKILDVLWRGAGRIGKEHLWDTNNIQLAHRNLRSAVAILVPEIGPDSQVLTVMMADLKARGFTELGVPDVAFPVGGMITNFGITFLRFVLDPKDRP